MPNYNQKKLTDICNREELDYIKQFIRNELRLDVEDTAEKITKMDIYSLLGTHRRTYGKGVWNSSSTCAADIQGKMFEPWVRILEMLSKEFFSVKDGGTKDKK